MDQLIDDHVRVMGSTAENVQGQVARLRVRVDNCVGLGQDQHTREAAPELAEDMCETINDMIPRRGNGTLKRVHDLVRIKQERLPDPTQIGNQMPAKHIDFMWVVDHE